MKRLATSLIVCFCCLFLLSACSRSDERATSASASPTTAVHETGATQSPAPASTLATNGSANATTMAAFRVTDPPEGAKVTISELVRGTTAYPQKHHYVVITPDETPNVRWIQEGTVTVQPDGTWRGSAQFGQGDNGVGKHFTVRCMATASVMRSGEMDVDQIPADAVFSPANHVTRTR